MRILPSAIIHCEEQESDGDTAVINVLTKSKLLLGTIRWHVPFRSYVFVPAEGRLFAYRVLADITSQIIAMMDEWARAAGRKPTHGKSSPYRQRQKRCGMLARVEPSGDVRCGRWLGHDGPHRPMGSKETWGA